LSLISLGLKNRVRKTYTSPPQIEQIRRNRGTALATVF
jgi:hypothetical protein